MDLSKLKVALVYDKVNTYGGAERVLIALHQLFPQAPLYTSVYRPESAKWASVFPKIYTSFLQNLPLAQTSPQVYSPLMPLAFEQFNFSAYDLAISISSYESHGILTSTSTKHIHYCLTPNRYLWVEPGYNSFQFPLFNSLIHSLKNPLLTRMRIWDQQAISRADHLIAISAKVQDRITKYYRRSSQIIYPPVDTQAFPKSQTKQRNHFLVVSRLMPYKQVGLVAQAFIDSPYQLEVIGTGPLLEQYRSQFNYPNIHFRGHVPQIQLAKLYQTSYATIMPQPEDFGIVALESLASSRPVIINQQAGSAELIRKNMGIKLTPPVTLTKIKEAVDKIATSPLTSDLRQQALNYNQEAFQKQWVTTIQNIL